MSSRDDDATPGTSVQQQQLSSSSTLPQLHEFHVESRVFHGFRDSEGQVFFHEVVDTLFSDFAFYDIITVGELLDVKLNQCSPDQLRVLNESNILLKNISSCDLISYSSAKHLCEFVENDYNPLRMTRELPHVQVYHTLGGRCDGFYMPDCHIQGNSKCIMCEECGNVIRPRFFIFHSHVSDGYNNPKVIPIEWREYIYLHEDLENDIYSRRMFNRLKYGPNKDRGLVPYLWDRESRNRFHFLWK